MMPNRDAHKVGKKEDVAQVVKRAQEWVASPEGQRKIKDSEKSALEMTERLREARRVDPKILRDPMTH